MHKLKMTLAILALCIITPAALPAADEKEGDRSLDVLADDLKFQNGVYFIGLKMYDKALETLNEYLEIYYTGNHRHEAYKLIADIYFNRMEYFKAIQNYQALYEEFSGTDSGVEAYYHLGLCYNKMGYEKKAAEIFNEIIENHSDSIYAQQARLQLDVLQVLEE